MSTPRCKPGDLVLVIKGEATGITATILRQATDEERVAAARRIAKKPTSKVTLLDGVSWVLDKDLPTTVKNSKGEVSGEGWCPFRADSFLLPITPPASMTTKEQSKELSHG